MNINDLTQQLATNKTTLSSLLTNTKNEEYLWKPEPSKWCMLEIACHLYDEEREDFRARLKHILETPEKPFVPFDPIALVQEKNYIGQPYEAMIQHFLNERDQSIEWLQSLNNPKWDNVHHHPKGGPTSAKMMFSNWVAHDYLHIRQITRLKFNYLQYTTSESLSYAGDW